jgi:hypothetical protein
MLKRCGEEEEGHLMMTWEIGGCEVMEPSKLG